VADQVGNDACSAGMRVVGADVQGGARMLAVGTRSQDAIESVHTHGLGARTLGTSAAVRQHIVAHTAVPRKVRVRGAEDQHRRQAAL